MDRLISGFHQDEQGDWVAELSCLHGQHVRHRPPFTNRPWTSSEEGRNSMLGSSLNCVCCDRLEMPGSLSMIKQTMHFTESTMPKYLIQGHMLEKGCWAKIVVLEGALGYSRLSPANEKRHIDSSHPDTIAPNQVISLKPEGPVLFYLELYTLPV
ncbi:MAG: DUF3565 domain-containing protein [Hahellaceae bacterium]|nr:DUF3565 domain-containing protein [Hahellaceae bacterium]MCP5211667.1 DUF3565 domain-containing protein [Hahellaceae bacterium]